MSSLANKHYTIPESSFEIKTMLNMNHINGLINFIHGIKELKLDIGNVANLDLKGSANFE